MAFACTTPAVPTLQRDDADVRITRWDFAPGAVTGWHSHGLPYFIVMLTDSTMRVDDGKNITDYPRKAGDSYSRASGIAHDVMNASDTPMAFVEIEVKRLEALIFS
ncbi:cupin domain-containing protein [Acidocella sp.]|uniref:cupin domain-containing protein n=1 Tax=Acidocella sp. TaxID=50710 RepID=UPI00181B68E4|nr:cupin domain-containing protein [Acidocella sp.]NNM56072.1 cupin [Acidocella sp.]